MGKLPSGRYDYDFYFAVCRGTVLQELPDSVNAKTPPESGVCKSTGVEGGDLIMILLMLLVCLILRLRRLKLKIDFRF